ncbi:sulfide/dihydroorotate dehydrogenase-like FAD/NAD-binding protein [Thermococcus sp. MV5]|uniref:sulfide/dihydroorotate dehydrogenase-like FAD/NAD-binding protein n=1 Tax=Thermococcus sp. MV5 TaxID=1638272 RepID=UPI00143C2A94|nr:sulfide/dihydroorotate dehydrogenase-like FAD/NAD-binding protein [Thermococcus sp. MV5]NJE26786.1 sulfide/dihydroorotate dehydrogenase-like FAD/NAD-binding protein [Thermococcus sp. MV5]
MYEILEKKEIAAKNVMYKIHAPHIAKKVQPGQFVVVRAFENGERIPLTPVTWNREKGWITLVVFSRGKTTLRMNMELKEGDKILNIAGPLGNPVPMKRFGKILAIGMITGIVEVYPIAKAWQDIGNEVITLHIVPEPMILLRKDLENAVSKHIIESFPLEEGMGMPEIFKELVTRGQAKVKELIEVEKPDLIFMVGPAGGQKAIFDVAKEYGVPMNVDLHPVMVDGTGMCGACRVTIGEEVKFACVDGPSFDAYKVNWEELIARSGFYTDLEKKAMEDYLTKLAQGGVQ